MRFWLISTKVKKDRLDRSDHRKNDKRLIPPRDARNPTEIRHDPEAEDCEMQVDEQHTAGETGNRICDAFLGRRVSLLA